MYKLKKMLCLVFLVLILLNNYCSGFNFVQPTIETERLILRPLSVDDASGLFVLTSDIDVAKLTSMFVLHANLEETVNYIKKMLDLFKKGEVIPWIVLEKESKQIVGFVRFLDFSITNARGEIGYAFITKHWNKGYSTEASKALINFGFNTLNLVRIQATVDPKNIASNRVLEKCGMIYEGLLRDYKVTQGTACDRKMYAITRSDFLK